MLLTLKNPTFRHLFAAQIVALIGTGLATVALGLLAWRLAGEDAGAVLGTALAIKMVAYVTLAPIAAAVAERLPRRAFLVALDLIRAGVIAFLPFVEGLAGLYMAFGRDSWRLGQTMPGPVGAGGLSGAVGFFSALMGIGGGTFGVPLMTLYNMPIHRAVGTASGFWVLIAVPAVLGFLFLNVADAPPYTIGAVSIPAVLIVIGSTLVTTPLGVRLAHAMNPKPLKRAFAIFLTLVALNMLRKVFGW